MRKRHFIDSHKGVTFIAVLVMIWYHSRWQNTTAWVYLALHGTYGILWVIKSRVFPDKQWEQPASLAFGLAAWAGLSLYWVTPWLITSRDIVVPSWYLALCVSMHVFGIFLHFASDMQKYTALALRPGLITTGLFARTRNPNYLGELLVYLGFTMLAMHWFPLTVLGFIVVAGWVPFMIRKDRSLSRYPDFADYKKRSGLLFPF
jgi:protein-S-isoprenylcysteine O-methyltransferase Ste14